MSIADHFEHTPDGGFVRNYDSGAARRQFNVSLVLIALIAAVAATLGMLIHFDAPPASVPVATGISTPAYVGKL